jgi:putative ABC transport system permease protein
VLDGLLSLWPREALMRHASALLAVTRARRQRHGAAVLMAGIVASLSLSVAITVMVASFRVSVIAWLDVVLPADLYVRVASSGSGELIGPGLPPDWPERARALAGVRSARGAWIGLLSLDAARPPVALIARPFNPAEPALPLMGPLRTPPPGRVPVYVSEAMVDLYGAAPGHTLALPLQAGQPPLQAWVAGVWRDYARQSGAFVMDLGDYRRATGDTRLTDLGLWLQPPADDAAATRIAQAMRHWPGAEQAGLQFAQPREIRAQTLRTFDRSFAVTVWLQAVAIGIGLFGTAASFSAQVLARRKEFGLLAHLGFTRRQVLGVVAAEGAVLGVVGAAVGLALGLLISLVLVKVVNPQSFHWSMDMSLPWPRLLALCGAVVLAGTATAWLAGRRAVSLDAVQAVKEET